MERRDFCKDWLFLTEKEGLPVQVTLPHDAMLVEGRSADAPSGSAGAYFHSGKYRYEKAFTLTKEEAEGTVLFEFEAVYKNAVVAVNGRIVGRHAYGYGTFLVDATGAVKEGHNEITVDCENMNQPDSRWYSGAGITRPVWLYIGKKAVIRPQALWVRTLEAGAGTTEIEAELLLDEVSGSGAYGVRFTVLDADGAIAAAAEKAPEQIEAVGTAKHFTAKIAVEKAKLWSEDTPVLYTLRAELIPAEATASEGTTAGATAAVDCAETKFGIRKITKDARGIYVNGKKILLKGGCIHADNGIVGAATYDESEWRRVRILKANGFNAIRSAHNPASRALLDACDALGVYVMDESWDMWFSHKSKYDYAGEWRDHYLDDLREMVAKDYNHPSVILYSIGNEVSEPVKPGGIEAEREMVALLHEIDPSRLVTGGFNLMIMSSSAKGKGIYKEEGGRESDAGKTSGMNSTLFNFMTSIVGTGMNKAANGKKTDLVTTPALDALDVAGYNYASGRYKGEGKLHPNRLIVGSETFPQDIAKNWEMVKTLPYLAGDFMWTAWDYIGEVGIGAWGYTDDAKGFDKPYPWLLADAGAFDILGNPNGEVFLAQAAWGAVNAPRISVQPINHGRKKPAKAIWRGTNGLPSWSWSGCAGAKAVVEVYSDALEVGLELNGQIFPRKKLKEKKATFTVAYTPGTLTAIAYNAMGKEVSRTTLTTTEGGARPVIRFEENAMNPVLAGNGRGYETAVRGEKDVAKSAKPGEILYVDISMRGTDGIVESNADETLQVTVTGGELLGFGSANPRTEEAFQTGKNTTYYGRSQAIIRAGESGEVTLTVRGKDGEVTETLPILA